MRIDKSHVTCLESHSSEVSSCLWKRQRSQPLDSVPHSREHQGGGEWHPPGDIFPVLTPHPKPTGVNWVCAVGRAAASRPGSTKLLKQGPHYWKTASWISTLRITPEMRSIVLFCYLANSAWFFNQKLLLSLTFHSFFSFTLHFTQRASPHS